MRLQMADMRGANLPAQTIRMRSAVPHGIQMASGLFSLRRLAKAAHMTKPVKAERCHDTLPGNAGTCLLSPRKDLIPIN